MNTETRVALKRAGLQLVEVADVLKEIGEILGLPLGAEVRLHFPPRPILPRRLSGRCSSGAQRGAGVVFHAVPEGSEWGTALCGAKPGRLSGCGFVEPMDAAQSVTCPRCLSKLTRGDDGKK